MNYLLDTCVLFELTKPRPEAAVLRWLRGQNDSTLAVSALTIGELERGVERLPAGQRKRTLSRWLDEINELYSERVLDVTSAVARDWGRLSASSERQGKTVSVMDGLIGATARVHELVVATRNVADLERAGAKTFNPWTYAKRVDPY